MWPHTSAGSRKALGRSRGPEKRKGEEQREWKGKEGEEKEEAAEKGKKWETCQISHWSRKMEGPLRQKQGDNAQNALPVIPSTVQASVSGSNPSPPQAACSTHTWHLEQRGWRWRVVYS